LLEYVCDKALLGETEQIKASIIAVEVFGRSWDFDESKDAIVRVEAHRLRRKLAKYYEAEGVSDPIRIVLSPGSYVPEFVSQNPEAPAPFPPPPREADGADGRRKPSYSRSVFPYIVGGMIVIIITAATTAVLRAHRIHPAPSATVIQPWSAAPPTADREVRILAGSSKGTYVDRFGNTWGQDRFFQGGAAEPGPKDFYGRPPDAGLFTTMRTGEFSYNIPVSTGVYELRLSFAEPIFRASTESFGSGENERRFNVSLNGALLLRSFDVVADSGIAPVDIRSFKDVRPGPDGMVRVRFSAAYGTPFVNGVELIPTTPGRATPIRIRAHELSFTDHLGRRWSPDNYFIGGRLATHKEPVTGTDDPELYGGERYGNFIYSIPVPTGKYAVTLYFAETWFHPDSNGQDNGGRGDRVFDVYCNGSTLLKDFDVFAQAGALHAMSRTFHGIQPNGQGKIVIWFSPSRNYAAVKAIEVLDES
jgi:hypothetical protein